MRRVEDDGAVAWLRAADPAAGSEPDVESLRARVTALVGDVGDARGADVGPDDLGLRLRVARLLVEEGAGPQDAAAAAALLAAAPGASAPGEELVAWPGASTGTRSGDADDGPGGTPDARAGRRRARVRWFGAAAAAVLVVGTAATVAETWLRDAQDSAPAAAFATLSLDATATDTDTHAVENEAPAAGERERLADPGLEARASAEAAPDVLGTRTVTPDDASWSRAGTVRALALEPVRATGEAVTALARALGLAGEPVHDGATWTVTGDVGTLTVTGTDVRYERDEGWASPADADVLAATALLARAVDAAGLDAGALTFEVAPDGVSVRAWPGPSDEGTVGDGVPGPDVWTARVDPAGPVVLEGALLRRTAAGVAVRAVTDAVGADAPPHGVTLEVRLVPDGSAWVPGARYVVEGPDGTVVRPAS